MTTKAAIEGYFAGLRQKKGWDSFLADDVVFTSFTSPVKQPRNYHKTNFSADFFNSAHPLFRNCRVDKKMPAGGLEGNLRRGSVVATLSSLACPGG